MLVSKAYNTLADTDLFLAGIGFEYVYATNTMNPILDNVLLTGTPPTDVEVLVCLPGSRHYLGFYSGISGQLIFFDDSTGYSFEYESTQRWITLNK